MNDTAVVDSPTEILNIEPAQYVAQVFQPFQRRLAKAIDQAKGLEFDVTTTAGMKMALAHRAELRDLRTELESARKVRKAPILEIGKLLDSRAKEVTALITPHEDRFDKVIKAEEARKEADKQAKLAAERERVNTIQECIREFRIAPRAMPGKTSAEFRQHADDLANTPVTVEFFQEFHEEALTTRDESVTEMRAIADRAAEREQEEARIAEARAELDRQRAAQDERDRLAAAELREAQRKANEANEQAAAAMRAEQAAHEARMAEQKAEIDRERAKVDAERRRQEAEAEAKRRAEQERQDAEAREQREREAEEERQAAAKRKEADDLQRAKEKADFERDGPEAAAIVHILSTTYQVPHPTALTWLRKTNWKKIEVSQ